MNVGILVKESDIGLSWKDSFGAVVDTHHAFAIDTMDLSALANTSFPPPQKEVTTSLVLRERSIT